MKYLWASIVLLFLPLCICRGQKVECFINSFKTEYESKKETIYIDGDLIFVPTVMNLAQNEKWTKISLKEMRDSLWTYLYNPVLANGFAVDICTDRYYIFPEGWLYKDVGSLRANHMVEIDKAYRTPSVNALYEYLRHNKVDYVFTVLNFGYYTSNYWIIQNNKLIILMYDKESYHLYPVDAEKFVAEKDTFFQMLTQSNL